MDATPNCGHAKRPCGARSDRDSLELDTPQSAGRFTHLCRSRVSVPHSVLMDVRTVMFFQLPS